MSKKLIYLTSFVLVLGIAQNSAADAADPSLVGWWGFNEGSGNTAVDYSGYDRHGRLHGDPQWVAGYDGGALEFDGSGDYVNIDGWKGILGSHAITVSAWVKTTSTANASGSNEIVGWGPNTARQRFSFRIDSGRLRTEHQGGNVQGSTNLADGKWHHVAVTVKENSTVSYPEVILYLDGQDDTIPSTDPDAYNITAAEDVSIGRRPALNDRFFDGLIDEVRIYNRALTQDEIQIVMLVMQGKEWPFAYGPSPPDGSLYEDAWIKLEWLPGYTAASHDVYFGEHFEDVNDGTGGTFQGNQTATWFWVGSARYPYLPGLVAGTTYYWRIDEVNDLDPNSPWKGNVWSFTVPPRTAYEPDPPDGAEFVDPNVILRWTAGFGAMTHTVYFGDNFDDVDNATGGLPQRTTIYTPGPLELEEVYYWRVDEFDGVVTHKGDVWSFGTLPKISITDPNLVGWWKFDEGSGNTAIDFSGNGFDMALHNTTWEDGVFEGAVHFHGVGHGDVGNFRYSDNAITVCAWVWHDAFRIGETERYVTVVDSAVIRKVGDGQLHFYITTDGNHRHLRVSGVLTEGQWHHVAGNWDGLTQRLYFDGVEIASQAPGGVLGDSSNVIMSLRNAPFNGMLDEVRIYNRALTQEEIQLIMRGKRYSYALNPVPSDGARFMGLSVTLRWTEGFGAKVHDIYLGTDKQAVSDADTSDTTGIYRGSQSVTGYIPPEDLEFDRTYYWRVDEFDGSATYKGDVWSFTVVDPLSEALDTALRFTTGGSADWFSQTTTSYHDGDAAQSGDISHNQELWMQTTVSGTGTVSFYWKVSSEEDYDFLEFYIDGSLQNQISGSVNWQQKTYTISTSDSHTLEWRYVKDKDTDFGSDCGWVDKLEWVSN